MGESVNLQFSADRLPDGSYALQIDPCGEPVRISEGELGHAFTVMCKREAVAVEALMTVVSLAGHVKGHRVVDAGTADMVDHTLGQFRLTRR